MDKDPSELQSRRYESYQSFLDFVRTHAQRERKAVNRRMFSVFLWCFLAPVVAALTVLILIQVRVLPIRSRAYLEWLILFFPIGYSIYFLSFEVLRDLPAVFRMGGIANLLKQPRKDAEWRREVCTELARALPPNRTDWQFIAASFRNDIEAVQIRTRYITGLAGAVLFLILQGIDLLGADLNQLMTLTLFLLLLYLSGSQAAHYLRRYLVCAELLNSRSSHDAHD